MSALKSTTLKFASEPMFKFISPCAVVVTVWTSSNTLVPAALPSKIEISTVTLSSAIIVPSALRKTAWYLNSIGVCARIPVTANKIATNTNDVFFMLLNF